MQTLISTSHFQKLFYLGIGVERKFFAFLLRWVINPTPINHIKYDFNFLVSGLHMHSPAVNRNCAMSLAGRLLLR